jgi:hypothetical protein
LAVPAQLKVKASGDGYLRLSFVQDEVAMKTLYNDETPAEILLQYPRQGELVRSPGEPSRTEQRAAQLNAALEDFNGLLASWCS